MRARSSILVVVAVTALAACTGARAPVNGPDRSVPNETLLLGTSGGPLAVDVPSGSVVVNGRGAVASADGARIYTSERSGATTVVRTIDAATGDAIASATVRGRLDVRVVSATGDRVAMMAPLAPGYDAWTPVPRASTTIVVADPSGGAPASRFRLEGNFEPEAFSTGSDALFLIQYLPAQTPTVYRVTELDLRTGDVRPAVGPFKGPAERMPGTRLEQVPAVDGSKLFTLYTSERPGFAPHAAPVPANAIVSFVHVLSLAEGWAHCVGLPKALWHQPASAEAMAVSPDGRTLYIADADKGLVVTMDTESLDTSGPFHVDLPAPGVRTTATVSADGSTLFVGTAGGDGAVTAVDTSSFDVSRTWSTGGGVSGLGLSLDGARLYVALTDRLEVLNAASGRDLGDVSVASPAPIQAISAIAA
jgi:DNA-binding beta-propeller fold protein YncE